MSLPYLEEAVSEINKRSNGQLIIEIYPAFSLGFKPPTWFRDHKEGLIDISCLFNLMITGEEPSFTVIEAACLFDKKETSIKALEALSGFKKRVYKDVWNSELIVTGVIPSWANIVANKVKQVRTPEDLKGLKLRADSMHTKDLYEHYGAAMQFMPKSEMYMAVKTGVLDGYASGYGTNYREKLHEVVDYFVVTGNAPTLQEDIVVSPRLWDPLPEHLKRVVSDAFAEWAANTKADAIEGKIDMEDKAQLEKAGAICTDFSEADQARVREQSMKLRYAWVQSESAEHERIAEAWELVKEFMVK